LRASTNVDPHGDEELSIGFALALNLDQLEFSYSRNSSVYLARDNLVVTSKGYISKMGSIPESESNGTNTTIIPIIDLSPFTSSPSSSSPPSHASSAARLQAAQDLVRACREVGFVYVKNHGIPQDELDKAFALSKQFYDLPTAEKMKAPHPPGWAVHRGYSWPGLEKVSGALSEKNDEEWVSKLREVQDYKVRPSSSLHALRLVLALPALPPDHPLY
jgi:hypothetical protein